MTLIIKWYCLFLLSFETRLPVSDIIYITSSQTVGSLPISEFGHSLGQSQFRSYGRTPRQGRQLGMARCGSCHTLGPGSRGKNKMYSDEETDPQKPAQKLTKSDETRFFFGCASLSAD